MRHPPKWSFWNLRRRKFHGRYTAGLYTKTMSALVHFGKWLWSDWGKPNRLTRLGIPRIITNLLAYLLVPYLLLLSLNAYSSGLGNRLLPMLSHNPFLLSSYTVFYVCVVTGQYLESIYRLSGRQVDDKFSVMRQSWKDPFVKIFWLSGGISLGALFIGGLQISHQLSQLSYR